MKIHLLMDVGSEKQQKRMVLGCRPVLVWSRYDIPDFESVGIERRGRELPYEGSNVSNIGLF